MAVTAIAIIASGNFIHYTIVSGESTKVVALFITLPRQAMMVQCIFGFFNAFLSWQGDRRQLDALGKAIHMLGDQDVSERIRFSSISINVNGKLTEFSSIDALATKVADCGAGRITLRGANGSGKTTLLAYFAELYKSRAFFLPTRNSEIYFSAQSLGSLSDGVRLRAIINEMVAFDEVSIFLLDEWDANLDPENMFEIDAMIEGIAARRLVIESRHR
jgi:ABC-type bacteriocin/lantibiotic exporter with double-glycine peptidase domain